MKMFIIFFGISNNLVEKISYFSCKTVIVKIQNKAAVYTILFLDFKLNTP